MRPPGYQHAFHDLLRVARTPSLHQCTVLRVSSLQQLAACALLLVHMCMAGTKMHRRAAILVKHALHELAKFSVNCREGVSHQRICKGVFAGSCTTTYFALCLVICRSVRCIGLCGVLLHYCYYFSGTVVSRGKGASWFLLVRASARYISAGALLLAGYSVFRVLCCVRQQNQRAVCWNFESRLLRILRRL